MALRETATKRAREMIMEVNRVASEFVKMPIAPNTCVEMERALQVILYDKLPELTKELGLRFNVARHLCSTRLDAAITDGNGNSVEIDTEAGQLVVWLSGKDVRWSF